MKKLAAILAVMLVGGAALFYTADLAVNVFGWNDTSFRLPGEVTAVSLEADPAITQPITLTDSEQIAEISTMLDGSQPFTIAGLEETQPQTVARLGLEMDKDSAVFLVLSHGDELLFSDSGLQDGRVYMLADSDRFFSLTARIDGFYRYGDHPQAVVAITEQSIPVTRSSFSHIGLDGRMTLAAPPAASPLTITDWGRNRLPEIEFSRQPQTIEVAAAIGADEVFRGTLDEAANLHLLPNTSYRIEVIARYQGENYRGVTDFGYTLQTNGLATVFTISGSETDLGETLILWAENFPQDGQVAVSTSLARAPAFRHDGSGGGVALLPVSIHTAPGEHYVELRAQGGSARFVINVRSTEFVVQRFNIDQSVADRTVNSAAANAQYREVIHPLRQVSDPIRHWEGRFIRPVEGGRITTPFAVIRFVNNAGPTRHAAIDIALPTGTPVIAPANGRVLFAGYLQLTGNTIAIEHGLGLKTWYYHLDSLNVATGDMVGQGVLIGRVGSTGFSTGPHLHYGMSVYDVFINPDTAELTDLFNLY
ncbi:MAG: M23 family metallopeptidase [Oscillospiraceae bacterium]|nr:M23 family metallopeptidase [Oscillospiraceae bacterium]